MNLAISQSSNEEYARDQKAAAFFNAWKKALSDFPGIVQEEGIDRNEDYCAFAIFPEELVNWTEGSLDDKFFYPECLTGKADPGLLRKVRRGNFHK